MISCYQLTKRFGAVTAVNTLSLEVAKGAICAFLGPNGAGKSTTVKMLSGLLAPTSGQASVCGFDVATHPLEVKRRIGVLPENLGLFDDLTMEEHLLLTAQIYGLAKRESHARMEQLLRVLSLTEGRNTFAAYGSHGMRKKTAFAMALLPNPEVLFLDEPFEAIDPATSKIMRDLLVSAAARHHRVPHLAYSAGGRAHRPPVRHDSRGEDRLELLGRRTAAPARGPVSGSR